MNQRMKYLIFIAIICTILVACSQSSADRKISAKKTDTGSTSEETLSSPDNNQGVFTIGQSFVNNQFEIIVNGSWRTDELRTLQQTFEPSQGATFVVVYIKYRNVSKKPVSAFDPPRPILVDADGYRYDWHMAATGALMVSVDPDRFKQVSSTLFPGVWVQDAYVYEVGDKLFDPATWILSVGSNPKVTVSLDNIREGNPSKAQNQIEENHSKPLRETLTHIDPIPESSGAVEKALEDQLACLSPPDPGTAIRSMLKNGLLELTNNGGDGIPVLKPTKQLMLYGKPVVFIAGWKSEPDGTVRYPFTRNAGSAPPTHLAASFKEDPAEIPYKEHEVSDDEGHLVGSFSSIASGQLDYSDGGSTITCYAGG